MRYLGRISVAMLVVAGALALAVAGARPAGLVAWDISGNWVGQDEGIYVIHQSGATVTWYAHSPDGKTWAHDFKGTLQGDYIVGNFQDRAGYTNHYNGTIALKITNADHMVWVASYKGVASFPILTRAWTRETTVATPKLPTFTAVVCNIGVGTPSTCAAEVADKSPVRTVSPTGTVTFSAGSGQVGSSCTLAGTPGSPGISSCTVSYTPAASLVQGEPPPVNATYHGDATFSPSSGGSSYKPASVLVPASVPVDVTSTSGGVNSSTEGVPTDLTNQNPFPVSADEQLTVPGNMDTTMIRAGSRSGLVAPKRRVIAHAAFRLAPLTTTPARLALSPAGRLLLRKHKVLRATVTVTIRAAGKPTQSLARSVSLRAR